tara:strand:- start:105 stop:248 length:144 start_codon:yes stop_codon:yes gene_type:complete
LPELVGLKAYYTPIAIAPAFPRFDFLCMLLLKTPDCDGGPEFILDYV